MMHDFQIKDGTTVSLTNGLFFEISKQSNGLQVTYQDAQPNLIKEKPVSLENTRKKANRYLKSQQPVKESAPIKVEKKKLADTLTQQNIRLVSINPTKSIDGMSGLDSHRLKVKPAYIESFRKADSTVPIEVEEKKEPVMTEVNTTPIMEPEEIPVMKEETKPVYHNTEFKPSAIPTIEGLKEETPSDEKTTTVVPISPEAEINQEPEKEGLSMNEDEKQEAKVVETADNLAEEKIPTPADVQAKMDRAKTRATEISKNREDYKEAEHATKEAEAQTQQTLAAIDESNKKQAEAVAAIASARKSLDEQLAVLDHISEEIKEKAKRAREEEQKKKEILEVAKKEEKETLAKEAKVQETRQTLENANTEIAGLIKQAQNELNAAPRNNTVMFPTAEVPVQTELNNTPRNNTVMFPTADVSIPEEPAPSFRRTV